MRCARPRRDTPTVQKMMDLIAKMIEPNDRLPPAVSPVS